MSAWLIGVVTAIYLGVAMSFWLEHRPWMAVTFVGYAAANVGLIMDGLQAR